MVASSLLECRDDRKRAEELAKESGDLGIEVMEYIHAAGIVLCVLVSAFCDVLLLFNVHTILSLCVCVCVCILTTTGILF